MDIKLAQQWLYQTTSPLQELQLKEIALKWVKSSPLKKHQFLTYP